MLETTNENEAKLCEIKYIAERGYYNIAKGGDGGNTGRNHEHDKIAKQIQSIKKHWDELPESSKKERVRKSKETKIKNGTYKEVAPGFHPGYGTKHNNWHGFWVVFGVQYNTLMEAAAETKHDQSTIMDWCIRKCDIKWKRKSRYIGYGKTPRECGCYRKYSKTKEV